MELKRITAATGVKSWHTMIGWHDKAVRFIAAEKGTKSDRSTSKQANKHRWLFWGKHEAVQYLFDGEMMFGDADTGIVGVARHWNSPKPSARLPHMPAKPPTEFF
jgi:hypothetical protein